MKRPARLTVAATFAVALGGMALTTTPAAGIALPTKAHHFLFIRWGKDTFNLEPLPPDETCVEPLVVEDPCFAARPMTFTGVTREATGETCHSEGAAEGEVTTAPLESVLGYINKKKGEVGLEAYPIGGGLFARFICGTTLVEWKGGLVYALTPANKVIKEGSALSAKTTPAKLEGGDPKPMMEAQENGGGFDTEEFVDEGEIKPEEGTTIEIKAKGKRAPEIKIKSKKKKK
jgi:hypothetical protein